jgi:hypothetical protein
MVSIPRLQTPLPTRGFNVLMSAAGYNTGNMLFTNAVWDQVDGPKQAVGFNFNPEKLNSTLGALVIPAANWFSPRVDFSDLADRIEKLDIPVVMIGLGAQDSSYSHKIDVPDGTVRLVRAVAERSKSVSVRGQYTKDVLANYGITNVTVTGCPSLYQDFRPGADQLLAATTRNADGPLLLHSTRYFASHRPFAETPSIHRDIFRLAYETATDLLMQSEPEEISMIVPASDKPEITPETMKLMLQIYGASNQAELEAFVAKHAHVFFDIPSWSQAMSNYGHVFGTRLHATIMALNSGVPAMLVHHDSRTQEVAEFAKLPATQPGNDPLTKDAIRKMFRSADFGAYRKARVANAATYADFLAVNGLESPLSHVV